VPTKHGGADAATGPLRLQIFARLLGMVPTDGRSLVDLGAGHGKFATLAADHGWTVTAVDARGDRFPADDRVEWRVEDVRTTDLSPYDVIVCLGLFYHLTVDDQLSLLERCDRKPLILDTHVATGGPSPFTLSEVVTLRGYRGQLYTEGAQSESTSSWGNEKSFWARPKAHYRMLHDAGYDVMPVHPWYLPTRTFFLCLPTLQA
jgi:hypothetical protein